MSGTTQALLLLASAARFLARPLSITTTTRASERRCHRQRAAIPWPLQVFNMFCLAIAYRDPSVQKVRENTLVAG